MAPPLGPQVNIELHRKIFKLLFLNHLAQIDEISQECEGVSKMQLFSSCLKAQCLKSSC